MGAPGLAFETWDPCNEFPVDTRLCMSLVRDLQSLSFSRICEERNL
jgi:hypothetical protein